MDEKNVILKKTFSTSRQPVIDNVSLSFDYTALIESNPKGYNDFSSTFSICIYTWTNGNGSTVITSHAVSSKEIKVLAERLLILSEQVATFEDSITTSGLLDVSS